MDRTFYSIWKCFLCALLFQEVLFSAGPLMHLFVAEKFCERAGISDPEILKGIAIGAEFPDIRYITRQSRDLTHPVVSNLAEVCRSRTPFECGMKLHAWLDDVREQFISRALYDALGEWHEGHSATLLKFIEEEVLCDFYDASSWFYYFEETIAEEEAFADPDTIRKWHAMV
jgi:hypothetical protein